MNDRIMVGFRNEEALKRAKVVSEREFPVVNIFYDDNHTYAVVDMSDEKVFANYIRALTRYIIDRYETKILKRIILKNYPDIPHITVNEILKLKENENLTERRMVIEDILKEYFTENESGSVEGIVNFRLYEYKKILNSMAENMVDLYYLNREYDDFVELLRYFISVQTLRLELVFITVNSYGMYNVLNDNREDITKSALAEIVPPDEAENIAYDDLLISILISLAPKKIVVEHPENIKNKQLFETIEKVFENVEYK